MTDHARPCPQVTGLPVIIDFYSDGCGPCRQVRSRLGSRALCLIDLQRTIHSDVIGRLAPLR